MACTYLPFAMMLGSPAMFGSVILASLPALLASTAVVWLVRGLFGPSVARVVGYVMMALLAGLLILLAVQCELEMSVPVKFVGDSAIDNDGAARALILASVVIVPSILASIAAVWISVWRFSRQKNNVISA